MRVLVLGALLALPAQAGFHDMPMCHWAYPAVELLAQAGILHGTVSGREPMLHGRAPLSRGMLGALLDRASDWAAKQAAQRGVEAPPVESIRHDAILVELIWDRPFRDVPSDHWAADAVSWVSRHGILEGYPGPSRAAELMTRAQVNAAVFRWVTLIIADPQATDVSPEQAAWLVRPAEALEPSARAGIIEGYPDGLWREREPMCRYSFAVLLERALRHADGQLALRSGPEQP